MFNGRHNGFVDKPLPSKPGERVRLYVMNVGPSNTSSFHVVGTIFDRVWTEGNPDNQLRGMQTVLLGSSSGAIVEFIVPQEGSYVMVDHHFANASQGAIGLIAAGGKPDEHASKAAADTEHHNMPATATSPTDPVAVRGKLAFESKCLACHSVGGGDKLGPDVYGVTRRREESWLVRWMKNPEKMLETDPVAKEMLARYKVPMPNQNLSEGEVREYIAYFKWADANLRPQVAKPQPDAPGITKQPLQKTSATPSGGLTSNRPNGK